MKLASSPSRNCSITTPAPPALCVGPARLSSSMLSMPAWACCSVSATTTPLPAARPSALMTQGAPRRSTKAGAAAGVDEGFGEDVGAFQLCRSLGGAKDAQAVGPELVDHACGQRGLGADHRQHDLLG